MRALTAFAGTALLLLGACETAFVGRAPTGRYGMVSVNGRPPPLTRNAGTECPVSLQGGSFDLDSVARRFELRLTQSGPCARFRDVLESGSYLRRGGTLLLESDSPARRSWTGSESGDSVTLNWEGLRLRFRRDPPPR
ncbi:MAG TPA: hypothetical protein VF702_10100 [Allosphingosinicella sp.]|jgi:hypothetical protein